MVQLFRDTAYEAYQADGDAGIILHWLAELLDLVISVINERREKGFTMSFHFLGKLRTPLIMLAGVLMSLSAFSQLKPVAWYIDRPLYDAADALVIPALVFLGLGFFALLISARPAMSPLTQLAAIGVIIATVSLVPFAIATGTLRTLRWSGNVGTVFNVMMLTFLISLTVFSVLMAIQNYRQLLWFAIHPALILFMAVVQSGLFMFIETNVNGPGPHWAAFVLVLSLGIAWMIGGYQLRVDLVESESPANRNLTGENTVQEATPSQ
jgi:hypothetical protein